MIWPFPRANLFRSIPSLDAYPVMQSVAPQTFTLSKTSAWLTCAASLCSLAWSHYARYHPSMVYRRLSNISPRRMILCCSMLLHASLPSN
jgi:hypothetical protein